MPDEIKVKRTIIVPRATGPGDAYELSLEDGHLRIRQVGIALGPPRVDPLVFKRAVDELTADARVSQLEARMEGER